MDEDFGFDEPVKRPSPKLNLWDMLTVLALLATLGVGAFFVFLFMNPTSPINLLQPHVPTPFIPATATITPIQLESTWTPTFISGTETPTLAPTITLQPSNTPISLVPPTRTPTIPPPTKTPKAPYSVTVSAIDGTIIHPDLACNWTGIGGTVVDASGAPVLYRTVRLTGTFDGKPVDKLTVSGTALDYGQSGFEFVLGTTPVASNKLLTLQLLDQGGLPLSENVYVVTYSDCKKNLILVRYKENR
jgi:hypothetical protein